MKKELFKLRHAALVSALALAMGAPLAFADEAPLEVPAVQSAPEIAPAPVVEAVVVVDTAPTVEALPVDAPVAIVEPLPVDQPPVIEEPVPVADPVAVEEPRPIDEPATVNEPLPDDAVTVAPVDDCGMICWNAAELPPGAVQKGGEEVDPQIMQFEAPEPSLNVSAELSGAVGVAEQIGAAADVAAQDAATVEPLAETSTAPAVVATATGAEVNVIRDGHLH